ncbi:MAG: hypothetical protein JKY37_05725 [Nannocystaceae bacterium]|nr:hypothetical protein [Nannocystaceae bacterium]
MAGTIIQLMEQRHLDFSSLAPGASEIVTLHNALPVACYKSALLMVRIHSKDIGNSPARFLLRLYPTLPSKSDGRQFTNTGLALADVEVNGATIGAPAYLHDEIPALAAAYLLVQIHVEQSTAGGSLSAQLSAELLLRES